MPSTAATTTGKYSGLQPAITALIATFSALITTARSRMMPTWWSGASRAPSSMTRTLASVGGTTGRPSDQPLSYAISIASASSRTLSRLDVNVAAMPRLLDVPVTLSSGSGARNHGPPPPPLTSAVPEPYPGQTLVGPQ